MNEYRDRSLDHNTGLRCRPRPVRAKSYAPLAATLLLLSAAPLTHAFEEETQTWTGVEALAPLAGDSFLGLRARRRFSDFFGERRLDQYQVTANRTLGNSAVLTGGYELFRAPGQTLEHRLFPQLSLRSELLGLPLQHRLRLEARDIQVLGEHTFRMRYLVAHTRNLTDNGAYLTLVDEVFFSASSVDGVVERGFIENRIGAAMGLPLGNSLTAEFGYQWRYFDSGFAERGDHLLQFRIVFDGRR